ncbi:MAG: hypothetical protein GEV06_09850 [Luteitalea sp.]|nr:hypothetical protein [Luteitalea sp.]
MRRTKLQPGVVGGLLIGVLTAIPYVQVANCCGLWLVSGGLVAAYLAERQRPTPLSFTDGAVVGMMAGVTGFATSLVLSIPFASAGVATPSLSRQLAELMDRQQDGSQAAMMVVLTLIFFLLCLVIPTLGGILGAALFREEASR